MMRVRKNRIRSELQSDSYNKKVRQLKKNKRHLINEKERFRKSKEWKQFRDKIAKLHQHRDEITGAKLQKGYNVHHMLLDLDPEKYQDISNVNNFIPLNSLTHDICHYLYKYWVKDPQVIDRLVCIFARMKAMNTHNDENIETEYNDNFDTMQDDDIEQENSEDSNDDLPSGSIIEEETEKPYSDEELKEFIENLQEIE